MRKMLLAFMAITLILLIGCATSAKYYLTVADIEPKLAYLNGSDYGFVDDDSKNGFVTYVQIGDQGYDDFFKSAAKLDGLVILGKGMTTTATGQLKKFAKSKASYEEMKDNVKKLVGDTPPEQWTTKQSFAVMKMAKQQNKISSDEAKYLATTAGSMGIVVVALGKGVKEATDLLPKGEELLENVKSLSLTIITSATKGVKESVENLNGVVTNTPKLLEEMKVILEGFKALSWSE
ncbi:MAG: hypothetical protein GY941_17635 [Planctomycetes bacterium]|nr:hypothetical protein [Planctomycetota bacterium]